MSRNISRLFGFFILSTGLIISGCASIDKSSLKAQAGSPESTQVEQVVIPRDPSRPTYVVAIEPFVFSPTFAKNENAVSINIYRGGEELAAKLTTALSNSGNISVLDSYGLKKNNDGTYRAKLSKGEVGPFVVRATVTEFTEVAEVNSEKKGVSLGWLGAVAGIAGAVSGNSGLGWTGAGVAAANPTIKSDKREKKGMVAIDLRIVDGRTSRVVGALNVQGTFASASATNGISIFGVGKETHQFAQSVLGQAVQVALNDAVKKITNLLTSRA